MKPNRSPARRWLISAAAAAGVALGAAGIAGAATGGSSSTTSGSSAVTTAQSAASPAQNPANLPNGPGETLLTGTTADKVKAAALAAVPGGTIIRVETDSAGSPYEAHMTKSDGAQVTVKVDADFKVTTTENGFGPGPNGPAPMNGQSPTSTTKA